MRLVTRDTSNAPTQVIQVVLFGQYYMYIDHHNILV